MEVRFCRVVSLPFMGMVMVILAQVTTLMVNKVAMSGGMSNFILVVYSNALSSLILSPSFFFFLRGTDHPPLNFSILCKLFLLALDGCLGQISGYAGIRYTNPTLGTAALNLVPAFTFILAIISRMERLDWRSSSTQAKSIGTLVSIVGAFVVTFYKGPPILTHLLLLLPQQPNWILGGFLLCCQAFSISVWYILQASVLEKCPAELVTVFLSCVFATIQSAVIALIAERDSTSWTLRADIGSLAIIYTAVIGTVFQTGLCSWCLRRRGPLYISMFKPLAIVVAFILGFLFLGDLLHLGSLIGALIIITGFYGVMWGRAKEDQLARNTSKEQSSEPSCSLNAPLLVQDMLQESQV